jgi:hypothetical protein
VLEETGYRVKVGELTGVYKNMKLGVLSLAFRCVLVGGEARTSEESEAVCWRTPEEVEQDVPEARAVRVFDALHADMTFLCEPTTVPGLSRALPHRRLAPDRRSRRCRLSADLRRGELGKVSGDAPVDLGDRVSVMLQRGRAAARVTEPGGGVAQVEPGGEELAGGVVPHRLDVELDSGRTC